MRFFKLLCFLCIDDEDVAWYPRQKVQSARKKLEGFNPAYVMRFVRVSFSLSASLFVSLIKLGYMSKFVTL